MTELVATQEAGGLGATFSISAPLPGKLGPDIQLYHLYQAANEPLSAARHGSLWHLTFLSGQFRARMHAHRCHGRGSPTAHSSPG